MTTSLAGDVAIGPDERPRYRLVGEIGRGGMARVYEAWDLRVGRAVAVKFIRSDLLESTSVERFRREIRTAARLSSHPRIVGVTDWGLHEDLLFYVMPLIAGESLAQRLEGGPIDDPRAAAELVRRICSALHHAHRHGIVHRDIKPANILISDGEPMVTDFGIARALSSEAATLTQVDQAVGTPLYMSPEQIRGEAIDGRSDLYSLGCILFAVLTGRPPFPGQAAIFCHLREEPYLEDSRIPDGLRPILSKLLAKQPEDRYPDARSVGTALAQWIDSTPPRQRSDAEVTAQTPSGDTRLFAQSLPSGRFRVIAGAGIAASVVGAIALLLKLALPMPAAQGSPVAADGAGNGLVGTDPLTTAIQPVAGADSTPQDNAQGAGEGDSGEPESSPSLVGDATSHNAAPPEDEGPVEGAQLGGSPGPVGAGVPGDGAGRPPDEPETLTSAAQPDGPLSSFGVGLLGETATLLGTLDREVGDWAYVHPDARDVDELRVEAGPDSLFLSSVSGHRRGAFPVSRSGFRDLADQVKREAFAQKMSEALTPGGSFEVELSIEQGRDLEPSQLIHLTVRASETSFLTLIDVTPEGLAEIIYPNRFDPGRPLAADQPVRLPPLTYHFRTSGAEGFGRIVGLVTTQRIPLDAYLEAPWEEVASLIARNTDRLGGGELTDWGRWTATEFPYQIRSSTND